VLLVSCDAVSSYLCVQISRHAGDSAGLLFLSNVHFLSNVLLAVITQQLQILVQKLYVKKLYVIYVKT